MYYHCGAKCDKGSKKVAASEAQNNVLIQSSVFRRVHLSIDHAYSIARRFIFLLPADLAHELGQLAFRAHWLWRLVPSSVTWKSDKLKTSLCGVQLDSPIGLAAGYDKDADLLRGLMNLDFSFITVGSITLRPRTGNPKPRIARITRQCALVNALGLPSKGLGYVLERLAATQRIKPVIGSIAGFTPKEIQDLVEGLRPLVDLMELNVSSPTFPEKNFETQLSELARMLATLGPHDRKKTLVKIPPTQNEEIIENLAKVCALYGVGGITATNTKRVAYPGLSTGKGGLSGKPLFEETKRTVALLRKADKNLQIVASGGVFTGKDAMEMIGYGANAISILTSFIYRGPGAPRRIKSEILAELRSRRFASVEEARGFLL